MVAITKRRNLALTSSFVIVASVCVAQWNAASAEAADDAGMHFTVSADTCVRLPSQWADYFGTHYNSSPEGAGRWWSTVRSYGGTHVGAYPTDRSEPHVGPFTGRTVRVGLTDFHSRMNRGGKSAEQLVPDLIEHRLTAIYQMTTIVRPSLEPFEKDLAYWTVYQIHKKFPEAWQYIAWQIGNEVVSGHFDPKGQRQQTGIPEEAQQGQFHGYDLDWKEDYYVEEYLAPAIEAIERASTDVYGDPTKIKILLGSMNPYNRQNIEFLRNVMQRKFAGKHAPTLAGDPVAKHIDVLTVHYMFGSERTVERMQSYVEDYLRTGKVNGIWETEEHGRAGKGPVTVIERGFRFMSWVAQNKLDASQARLVWWGDGARKPGGSARDAERTLGEFLAGQTIHFGRQETAGGRVYVVCDDAGRDVTRVLVALVPERYATLDLAELRLSFSKDLPDSKWHGRAIQYSADKAPVDWNPITERNGRELQVRIRNPIAEPALIMLERNE